jgi:hypothetical protein
MKWLQLTTLVVAFNTVACSSDAEPGPGTDAPGSAAPEAKAESLVFRTDPVTIEAGKEKFMCFTKTLDEDVVIDGYAHEAQPVVHHVVFVRPLVPEPEGFSECDVLFRMTWDPLFLSGAGRSELKFPDGLGHTLAKGTQLLVQLHLLNAGETDVTETVSIDMHRSRAKDPQPVGAYAFGTTDLKLPASEHSQVEGDCTLSEPVQIIAAFPHMHRLGRKLRFEGGPSLGDMHELFVRDPYDFDDQHTEAIELTLDKGDHARVTCDYDNTTAKEVSFGESTSNEMCFFIGFAVGRDNLRSCIARKPMDTAMP